MNSGHNERPRNVAPRGAAIQIRMVSNRLILIDPLALDGLAEPLAAISPLSEPEQVTKLQELAQYGLRIGLQQLDARGAATYELNHAAFERATDASHPGVFDIDSGTVVLIDAAVLHLVARALTWERYDQLCRGDAEHTAAELNREVGGPRFAVLFADADTPFAGDGSYQLCPGALRVVE